MTEDQTEQTAATPETPSDDEADAAEYTTPHGQAVNESAGDEQGGSTGDTGNQSAPETNGDNSGGESSGQPKKKRTKGTARKTRTVELTLTVTGTAEGEWQAELMHGSKRVVQGLSIPAAAVSKAAKELHGDISETIETVLHQAREQHEAKLAELEAEAERVRKALAELES